MQVSVCVYVSECYVYECVCVYMAVGVSRECECKWVRVSVCVLYRSRLMKTNG